MQTHYSKKLGTNIVLLSESAKNIDFLKREFPQLKFSLLATTNGEPINCFLCRISSQETLEQTWSRVTSLIAAEFQTHLESDFEIWNIYLVFVCSFPVDRALQYRIENDRFSMRKIILQEPEDISIEQLALHLNNDVLGLDLRLFEKSPSVSTKNNNTSSIASRIQQLGDIPLGPGETQATKRSQLLKILIEDLDNYENQIS